jgi:hypothetical protein
MRSVEFTWNAKVVHVFEETGCLVGEVADVVREARRSAGILRWRTM